MLEIYSSRDLLTNPESLGVQILPWPGSNSTYFTTSSLFFEGASFFDDGTHFPYFAETLDHWPIGKKVPSASGGFVDYPYNTPRLLTNYFICGRQEQMYKPAEIRIFLLPAELVPSLPTTFLPNLYLTTFLNEYSALDLKLSLGPNLPIPDTSQIAVEFDKYFNSHLFSDYLYSGKLGPEFSTLIGTFKALKREHLLDQLFA